MVYSTYKGLEVSECFGPILIEPNGTVLWSAKAEVKNVQENGLELRSQ